MLARLQRLSTSECRVVCAQLSWFAEKLEKQHNLALKSRSDCSATRHDLDKRRKAHL